MLEQSRQDIELGRFISLILRHNPSAAGIKLDTHGWANVDELLKGMIHAGKTIDIERLERIVQENDKQRYIFDEKHMKIRANQGHSIKVDVQLLECVPPAVLYHGTASRFLESIRTVGITKQSRQHVHLSVDEQTAIKVGSRHGKAVVLPIDTYGMTQDGYKFYLSENNVWLCENIPWKYVITSHIRYV